MERKDVDQLVAGLEALRDLEDPDVRDAAERILVEDLVDNLEDAVRLEATLFSLLETTRRHAGLTPEARQGLEHLRGRSP